MLCPRLVQQALIATAMIGTSRLDQYAKAGRPITASSPKAAPRAPHKARALPDHLPGVERAIEPESFACPRGCRDVVPIGEDRTRRPDFILARYQVMVRIRPKYAQPKGRTKS